MPSSKPVAGLLAGLDPAIDAQEGIGFDASATRRDGGAVDGAGDRIYLCLSDARAQVPMRVIFRDAATSAHREDPARHGSVAGAPSLSLIHI